MLDTACCNEIDRVDLLHIFSASWFEIQELSAIWPKKLTWLMAKNIKIKRIAPYLTNSVGNKQNLNLLKQISDHFTFLNEVSCSTYSCESLGSNISLDKIWRKIIIVNPNLRIFKVCIKKTRSFLQFIAKNATQLEHLQVLTDNKNKCQLADLAPIVQSCNKIKKIELERCEESPNLGSSYFSCDFKHPDGVALVIKGLYYLFDHTEIDRDLNFLGGINLIGLRIEAHPWVAGEDNMERLIDFVLQQNQLIDAHVHFFRSTTMHLFGSMLINNPNLLRLSVDSDQRWTRLEDIVEELRMNGHSLISLLGFSFDNPDTVNLVLKLCPQLRELDTECWNGNGPNPFAKHEIQKLRETVAIQHFMPYDNWIWEEIDALLRVQ